MLFNSWEFLILLALTVPLYYLPLCGMQRKVWQVLLLLVASAVFYAWEEPRLLLLLFGSCIVNAVAVERILFWKNGRADPARSADSSLPPPEADSCSSQGLSVSQRLLAAIRRKSGRTEPDPPYHSKAKHWLFWTVALNLAFLAFFKYAGFLANLLPESPLTESLKHWATGIPLPVGISFYTFQGISLVVDVWRNDISDRTAERLSARGIRRANSIADTSFYIAFFPQLVAGPIVKAHEFVDQIGAKHFRDIDWITVRRGLIAGYFLKIFVADNLAEQTVALTIRGAEMADGSPIGLMCQLYGYSLQIFADFAGYSLIAIGLGALFGYKLPPNFNFPYLSTSITEFWRRWHLSLSSWIRDYLYFPLGGNRKGAARTYFNLIVVMFLGGLWHGAAWKFALWGSLHGLFLAAERLLGARRRKHGNARAKNVASVCDRRSEGDAGAQRREHGDTVKDNLVQPEGNPMHISSTRGSRLASPCSSSRLASLCSMLKTALAWFCTFHLVTLLWLTFMMPDIASIIAFFKGLGGIFEGRTGFPGPPVFSLFFYGSMVVLYHAWGWLREHHEQLAHRLQRTPLEPLLHGVMVFLVVTNPGAPRGFIYFQF